MNTDTLTVAQRVIFERLILGESNKEIGAVVGRSEKTIKAHVTKILRALKCKSRVHLMRWTLKHFAKKIIAKGVN